MVDVPYLTKMANIKEEYDKNKKELIKKYDIAKAEKNKVLIQKF